MDPADSDHEQTSEPVPPRSAGEESHSLADRNQIASLWENARTAVFAVLLAEVGSFHDAEDLLQEVALAVASEYQKYDPQRPFVAWAIGIARNRVLMHHRKRRRDRLVFGEEMMRLVQSHLAEPQSAAADHRREALHECLKKLTRDQRGLLRLRYAVGLSLAELAENQDRTIVAIKGRLHRLRRTLHDCISRRVAASP